MNSAQAILISALVVLPTLAFAAPLYQPGETLNPACLPSNADCTVATSTASYFTATSTTATSTFPNLSLTNLLIGSDYLTDITGSGLSIVDGALTASDGAFATTSASYWINNVGNIGIGTSSPYTKLSVVGDIVATAITATSTFNTSGTTGGYKIDGNLILQASSTNSSTLLGRSAGAALLSDGLYNTTLGFEALKVATSSDSNTAVGYRALYANTTGAQNTANGAYSLYANTTGTTNTANGYGSLYSNTTGSNNSASGLDSLFSNTTGSNNTANGYYSLFYNTTGNQNSALGRGSLQANTTGSNNTATGYTSLYSNITGAQNTASGMYSLYYGTSTTYSTAIGYLSGVGSALAANDYNSTVDTYMTFLGASASRDSNVASTTALINATAIGYNAKVGGSNMLVLGNGVNVGIGTSTPSAKLAITGSGATTGRAFSLANSSNVDKLVIHDNGILYSLVSSGSAIHTRFISGAADSSYSDGDLFLQYGKAYDVRLGDGTSSSNLVLNKGVITQSGAGNNSFAGNLGLGTTTPYAKLSISSTDTASTTLALRPISGQTANILDIYNTGGTLTSVIDRFGNWGIGTTTPVGNGLTISAASVPQLTFADQSLAAGAHNFLMRYNSSIGTGVFQIGSAVDAGSANVMNLNLDRSGNMGIGTTTPRNKLEIVGTAVTGGSQCDTSNDLICLQNNVSTGINIITPSTLVGAVNFSDGTRAVGRLNYDHNVDAMSMWTGSSQRLTVDSSGNVGIGTTTTGVANISEKLVVTGDIFIDNIAFNSGMALGMLGGVPYIQGANAANTGVKSLLLQPSGGSVGLGTTTPSSRLSVTQSANTSAGGLWIAETGNTDFRSAYMDTSGILSFYGGDTAGALNTATLNAAGAWTNASDKSYKENIVDLGTKYGLATVLQTQPRFYEMKGTHLPQVGFIAQELNELVPEVVDGKDGSMGISYGNLVAVAFQAIKELDAKVASTSAVFTEWVGQKVSATLAVFKHVDAETITAQTATIATTVTNGIEMKDKKTGKTYCVTVYDGDFEKEEGQCKDTEEVKETPKENNDKPKDETPKEEVKEETATTTATTTPEVIKEEPKEEPKEEVKPQETASSTPETVVEEPKKEEEKPVEEKPIEEPKKEEVKEEVKSEEPVKIEEPAPEPVKEEPKVETPKENETQP